MNNPSREKPTIEYREIRRSTHGEELRWLVSREPVLDPTTEQLHMRAIIRHPSICVIVPFLEKDQIVLLRQYRYAVAEELWELPAGTLLGREEEQHIIALEKPEVCAARELAEETGYRANRLEKVAECYAIPGSGDELMHLFFAFELTKQGQSLDIGEAIREVKAFSLSDIESFIERGEIRDAKTLVGLFYALRRKS
jgi:ADP-ribose pyrophosphatase